MALVVIAGFARLSEIIHTINTFDLFISFIIGPQTLEVMRKFSRPSPGDQCGPNPSSVFKCLNVRGLSTQVGPRVPIQYSIQS